MRRIGVSTRIDTIAGRDEQRDALDIRWSQILWDLGYVPISLSSGIADIRAYLESLDVSGFILSGGNDIGSAAKRDCLEKGVLDYCLEARLPVLGICRGMQFINYYCGGSLVEVKGHVATRHNLTGGWAEKHGFKRVNSFHRQAISEETLAAELICLAKSDDAVVEALRHKTLPWLGIMWHPERETEPSNIDLELIRTHFSASASANKEFFTERYLIEKARQNYAVLVSDVPIIERLCKKVDVVKKVYQAYSVDISKKTSDMEITRENYVALFKLICFGATFLEDYKFLNTALKLNDLLFERSMINEKEFTESFDRLSQMLGKFSSSSSGEVSEGA